MTKKHDPPTPSAVAGDTFAVATDGDAFTPPTPEQEVQLWAELRQVLDGLVDRPAGPDDRAAADGILRRLGLDASLNPLFLTAVREAAALEQTIKAGAGQADIAAATQREARTIYNAVMPATTPEEARRIQSERERLELQFSSANRLAETAATAERQLRHLTLWLWPLFTPDANPFKEQKDHLGNIRRQCAGALAACLAAPAVQEAAAKMEINPYTIESWKTRTRPEPEVPRRRYRTSPLSQATTAPAMLGRNL